MQLVEVLARPPGEAAISLAIVHIDNESVHTGRLSANFAAAFLDKQLVGSPTFRAHTEPDMARLGCLQACSLAPFLCS